MDSCRLDLEDGGEHLQRTMQMTTDSLTDELSLLSFIPSQDKCSSTPVSVLEPMQGGRLERIKADVTHAPASQSKFAFIRLRGMLTVWRVNNQLDMLQPSITNPVCLMSMQHRGVKILSLFATHSDQQAIPVDTKMVKVFYISAQNCSAAQRFSG